MSIEETNPANVQTVSDEELERLRQERLHPGHPDHPDHPKHPKHPDCGDGDDDDDDSGDDTQPKSPADRHAAIERIAYRNYLKRGGGHSTVAEKEADWLKAEHQYDLGNSDSGSQE